MMPRIVPKFSAVLTRVSLAGNLKLTTNTNSTSNTTGDLVVAGGVDITQDVNIGGLVDIDSTLRVHSTSRFDDSMVIQGASKTLQLNNGSGTTRIELQSTSGNASFFGVVDITTISTSILTSSTLHLQLVTP